MMRWRTRKFFQKNTKCRAEEANYHEEKKLVCSTFWQACLKKMWIKTPSSRFYFFELTKLKF